MKRGRLEIAVAILSAVVVTVGGGAALYFVQTMAVHQDPLAVPATPGLHADGFTAQIDAARQRALALLLEDNLPGLSIAVAKDGELVWTEAFGWADVEQRLPATPDTQFRLGSVSKTLTAAAIGLLYERGRIDLDAPVQSLVPAYPVKQWPLTTRQLMGDIAGVHRIRGDNNDPRPDGHCANMSEVVATFSKEPLLFEPGTQYRFSNYGWMLASAVAEAAAGEPLNTFMTRELLTPLGMTSTVLDDAGRVEHITTFYIPRAGMRTQWGVRERGRLDNSCFTGAGAFFSTPSDLARFGSAMLKPGLLRAGTIAMLQTPQRLATGASTNFALGWAIQEVTLNGAATKMVAHRATPNGGTIALLAFPEHQLVVAAATNIAPAEGVDAAGRQIAAVFLAAK